MGSWFNDTLNSFSGYTADGQWLSDKTNNLYNLLHDSGPALHSPSPKKLINSLPDTLKAIKNGSMGGVVANDNYRRFTDNLRDNPNVFQGKGANAFFAAVDTDINSSMPLLDSFEHAGSAAGTLGTSIYDSSQKYDSKIAGISAPSIPALFADVIGLFTPTTTIPSNLYYKWRDHLITTFFTNMTNMALSNRGDLLSEFLQNGSGTMSGPWTAAVSTVQGIVVKDADQYASTQFDPAVAEREAAQFFKDINPFQSSSTRTSSDQQERNDVKQIESQFHQQMEQAFTTAFNNLAQDLHGHISGWAGELQGGYSTFQYSMNHVDDLTAGDLFQLINGMNPNGNDGTQNTANPITITPYTTNDGKKGLLITTTGLDQNHPGYDTDLFDALQTGQGGDNPYEADVERAIQQYMKEHPEMAGAQLTFAGYSYGGMTAQQVADDINNHDPRNPLSQYNLQVANVITYGAPVMGPPIQNGKVHYAMYDATYDPVPLLSSYENPILSTIPNPLSTDPHRTDLQIAAQTLFAPVTVPVGVGSLLGADGLPWSARHVYIDPTGQYGNQIHNISDVGSGSFWGDSNSIAKNGIFSTNPFYNHTQYQNSNQLDAPTPMSTAGTNGNIGNINPNSLGPTEYFGMQNTGNFGAVGSQAGQSVSQGVQQAGKTVSQTFSQTISNLLNTPTTPTT